MTVVRVLDYSRHPTSKSRPGAYIFEIVDVKKAAKAIGYKISCGKTASAEKSQAAGSALTSERARQSISHSVWLKCQS